MGRERHGKRKRKQNIKTNTMYAEKRRLKEGKGFDNRSYSLFEAEKQQATSSTSQAQDGNQHDAMTQKYMTSVAAISPNSQSNTNKYHRATIKAFKSVFKIDNRVKKDSKEADQGTSGPPVLSKSASSETLISGPPEPYIVFDQKFKVDRRVTGPPVSSKPWPPEPSISGHPAAPVSGHPVPPISGHPVPPISGHPVPPISGCPVPPISGHPVPPISGHPVPLNSRCPEPNGMNMIIPEQSNGHQEPSSQIKFKPFGRVERAYQKCRAADKVCPLCKIKIRGTTKGFSVHFKAKHRYEEYACRLCTLTFPTDAGFNNHINEAHGHLVYAYEQRIDVEARTKTRLCKYTDFDEGANIYLTCDF